MATSRLQKQEDADLLRQELSTAPHTFLVDFRGLDVAAATDLRRKLRAEEAHFHVVKNSVALRAIEGLPLESLSDAFVGQTAVAYSDGDVVRLAKTLREFAQEFETPNFKAGIVDGEPITIEEFEQLAKLPAREELIAKALYLMNYPISGLVTAMSGILRSAVTVLDQIRDQKEQAGDTASVEEDVAAAAVDAAPDEDAPAEAAEASDDGEVVEAAAEEDAPAEAAEASDDGEVVEAAAEEDAPAEAAGASDDAEVVEAAAEEDEPAEVAEASDDGEVVEAAAEEDAPAETAEASDNGELDDAAAEATDEEE